MVDSARILVVDDEEIIRFALRSVLMTMHFEVDCAESLDDAVAHLDAHVYGALLVDLRLSGSDDTTGLVVVSEARRRLPACRIVVLTAYGTTEMERRARAAGADDFLAKPQPLSEVIARVRPRRTVNPAT